MQKLFRANPWFFTAFGAFLLLGIGLLQYPQGSMLIGLNQNSQPAADLFFPVFTKVGEGYGYGIIFLVLWVYKRRAAWGIPLIGLGVSLLAWATKSIFQHPRPFLFFERQDMLAQLHFISGVKMNKGLTSFPSGHTMAAFALFSFLAFCFPRKPFLSISCFFAALLVGISRMYLVQHFFKDVYAGAILGVSVGIIAYLILAQSEEKKFLTA